VMTNQEESGYIGRALWYICALILVPSKLQSCHGLRLNQQLMDNVNLQSWNKMLSQNVTLVKNQRVVQ